LSSPIVFFTLRQDGHLPIPDRHHIPALHLRWRIVRIRTDSLHELQFSYYLLSVLFFSFFLFYWYVPFPRLNFITLPIFTYRVTRWRCWLTHCATNRKVADSIPYCVIILPADSASNRNECQEYFQGVEVAGVYGWQPYHLHISTVTKYGILSLLEHSGSVHCPGLEYFLGGS